MRAPIYAAALFAFLALLTGCGKQEASVAMKVYHGGNEYLVLDRGDTTSGGERTYFVRYLSDDPGNKAILEAECADLCAIISKHIDTNKHQRVLLEAVGRRRRLLGLREAEETLIIKSVAEVMAYKPEEIDPSPEVQ